MYVTRWLSRLRSAFAVHGRQRRSDRAMAQGTALPLGALALVVGVAAADVNAPADYLPVDTGYLGGAEGF